MEAETAVAFITHRLCAFAIEAFVVEISNSLACFLSTIGSIQNAAEAATLSERLSVTELGVKIQSDPEIEEASEDEDEDDDEGEDDQDEDAGGEEEEEEEDQGDDEEGREDVPEANGGGAGSGEEELIKNQPILPYINSPSYSRLRLVNFWLCPPPAAGNLREPPPSALSASLPTAALNSRRRSLTQLRLL